MGQLEHTRATTAAAPAGRQFVARSLGALMFAQGAILGLWLALERPDAHVWMPLSGVAGLAAFVGLLLNRGTFDDAHRLALPAIVALGTLMVAASCVIADTRDSGFAYLFVWITPYAVYFGLRHAVVQTLIGLAALVGCQQALGAHIASTDDIAQLVLPASTIVVVTTLLYQLARELGRADRERAASERERAEAESRRAASERERARRDAAMALLGRLALRASDRDALLGETVRVLTTTLDAEHCSVLERGEDGGGHVVVAASSVASDGTPPGDHEQLVAHALAGDKPLLVWEWASERRLGAPGLQAGGIRSTVATAIRGRNGPIGVIAVHAERVGAFAAEEGQWLQAVADLLASAFDRERTDAVVRHQSLHDALTGLPNRALLYDRIEQAAVRSERLGSAVAVLLLDVDQFKTINDSLGHQAGDELLIEVGNRLRAVVRPADTVARLGGDEFVVLAEVDSKEAAVEIADRIHGAWTRPISVDAGEVFVSVSVGIAIGREATSPETLLREADAAMYRAKAAGRGGHELFDEEMRRDAFERLRTESDLRRAVERGEFHVLYQPVFDVRSREPIGAEALVRWDHPTRGRVSPGEFIALAEETGLIGPLGRWVLEEAVREVAQWARRDDGRRLHVAVNVSGRQLARPEFLAEVRDILTMSGIEPGLLGLEITESVLMDDIASPGSTLEGLRELGVRVLIDDFGTGYSSLARLKRFPLDAIKIDRSFVDGLGQENDDTAIVSAVVDIARSMDLQVIAEGVESEQQLDRLRELGCHAAQGYLFSSPVDGDAFIALLDGDELALAS